MLDEPGVSREHARLYEEAGRFFVEDLKSFNGTKVNGQKIARPAELKDGDTVAMGQVVIAFVAGPIRTSKPPPPVPESAPTVLLETVRKPVTKPPVAPEQRRGATKALPELAAQETVIREQPPAAWVPPPLTQDTDVRGLAAPGHGDTEPRAELSAPGHIDTDPRAEAEATGETTDVGSAPRPSPGEITDVGSSPRPVAGEITDVGAAARPVVSEVTDLRAVAAEIARSETVIRDLPVSEAALASTETQILEAVGGPTPIALPRSPPPQAPLKLVSGGGGGPSAGLSAVERARRRREANESLGKLLKFHWEELSTRGRVITGSIASAMGLGIVITLAVVFWPASDRTRPKGEEPTQLSDKPVADSFGLGEGVTWERRDLKSFDFYFNSPTRAVAVLHYQAKDITPEEVSVTVNGVAQEPVPADSANADEREIEQVLHARDLKRNAKNVVIFDDVHNPPGDDPWRIWNLWVEVIAIPELPHDQLEQQARDEAAKARQFYDQRAVGSANLFRAWKAYRNVWLTLEALDERSELYQLARYELGDIGRQLDQQCGLLMLAARKAIELHHRKEAKQTLESVNAYFPTAEHRCHNLALEKLNQYDL